MAPLNGPPTKLHPKWSKPYRIVAVKGVLATVEESETEESITVHVDRLAFSRLVLETSQNLVFLLTHRFVLHPFIHCIISYMEILWSNPLCLQLRQCMPVLLRPIHMIFWISLCRRGNVE